MRDGTDQVLKQYVYGTRYVDNPVQIGVNQAPTADPDFDPQDEDHDPAWYWPIQDANFNVVGLVDSAGDLVERYEYTPYGQRSVFVPSGSNDEATSAPLYESQRVEDSGTPQAWSLCDIGHQGLFLDKEIGLYDNRRRVLHPRFGRFMQRDPIGYEDGMNTYAYAHCSPLSVSDVSGLRGVHLTFQVKRLRVAEGNKPVLMAARISEIDDRLEKILKPCFENLVCDTVAFACHEVSEFRNTPGFTYDDHTLFGNAPNVDLWGGLVFNPLAWITVGPRDLYVLATRKVTGYTQRVVIRTTGPVGITPKRYTSYVNAALLEAQHKGTSAHLRSPVAQAYANVIVHEAIFLGLLGRSDKSYATRGSLESPHATTVGGVPITEKECEEIRNALDVR
ncbi:MAG: RHS repeat-associated core domain-containing protein [Phycisphaerae bacterium]